MPGWIVDRIGGVPELRAGLGWAEESGVVRGDPFRLAAQPDVGAGAVSQVRRAPPDGAPGDRVAGPAGPSDAAAADGGAGRGLIDGMLREDLEAPRKQRHTAQRVFGRLCDEHDARVSYSYVAKYVQRRRAEILAEDRARPAQEAFL